MRVLRSAGFSSIYRPPRPELFFSKTLSDPPLSPTFCTLNINALVVLSETKKPLHTELRNLPLAQEFLRCLFQSFSSIRLSIVPFTRPLPDARSFRLSPQSSPSGPLKMFSFDSFGSENRLRPRSRSAPSPPQLHFPLVLFIPPFFDVHSDSHFQLIDCMAQDYPGIGLFPPSFVFKTAGRYRCRQGRRRRHRRAFSLKEFTACGFLLVVSPLF